MPHYEDMYPDPVSAAEPNYKYLLEQCVMTIFHDQPLADQVLKQAKDIYLDLRERHKEAAIACAKDRFNKITQDILTIERLGGTPNAHKLIDLENAQIEMEKVRQSDSAAEKTLY